MLIMRQTSTGEGTLTGIPASTVTNMLYDLTGKRSGVHLRKIGNGLVKIVVNKTEASQQLIQRIRQGDTKLQLSHVIGQLLSEYQKLGRQEG